MLSRSTLARAIGHRWSGRRPAAQVPAFGYYRPTRPTSIQSNRPSPKSNTGCATWKGAPFSLSNRDAFANLHSGGDRHTVLASRAGDTWQECMPTMTWRQRDEYDEPSKDARIRLARGQLPKPTTSAPAYSRERTTKAPPQRSNAQESPSSKIGIARQIRRNFA